jgi:short-subunit dehydrogenase
MDATSARKLGWLMPARDVAVKGYRGMLAGKRLVIPGFVNKVVAFSVRFAPRALVLRVSRAVQDRAKLPSQ